MSNPAIAEITQPDFRLPGCIWRLYSRILCGWAGPVFIFVPGTGPGAEICSWDLFLHTMNLARHHFHVLGGVRELRAGGSEAS